MNRVMTAGLDLRWRRLAAAAAVRPGDRVLDAACGTGDLALADLRAGAPPWSGSTSRRGCSSGRGARRSAHRVGRGRPARAAVRRRRRSTPRRSASASATSPTSSSALRELRRVLRPGRPARDPRDHPAARAPEAVLRALVRPARAAARQAAPRRRRVHLPAGVGGALPARGGARGAAARGRLRRGPLPAARGSIVALHTGRRRMNTLAAVDATPGLAAYMAELEARLARRSSRRPGFASLGRRRGARRRRQAAAAAALLPRRRRRARRELLLARRRRDRARAHGDARARRPRRRRPDAPRRAVRLVGLRARGGRSRAGDYLFACAFAELAATGGLGRGRDPRRRLPRARARRGDAARARRSDPETTIDAYLERCALKTGKLFEAACRLGSGGDPALGAYGLALGIAFQIADDILDCAGQTQETGKIPGTDLREGTPDDAAAARRRSRTRSCARALAGGPLDGALVRVAGDRRARALPRGRARLRRRRPRSCLGSDSHREELEALDLRRVGRHEPRPRARSASAHRSERRRRHAAPRRSSRSAPRCEAGERLDLEDGLALLESDDLLAIGELADLARRVRGGDDRVYFIQNLYLYQTNVCRVKCKFCAFAATQKQAHAYTLTPDEFVAEAVAQRELNPFTEIHMVNGENPHVDFDFYRRHDREAPRGAAGRVPQVLHGVGDPPHDDAVRAHARGGAARAAGGRARRADGRRRRGVRRPRAPARRARQGAPGHLVPRPRHRPPARHARPTARSSTGTSRPTRSGSTTCSGSASSRIATGGFLAFIPLAFHPANTVFERRGFTFQTGRRRPEDARGLAPDARQHPEHQGVLDLADDAGRPGRAPLRRQRRPGHARPRGDLPAAGSTAGTEQKLEELVRAVRAAGRIPVQRDTLYNELRRCGMSQAARSDARGTP